MQQLIDHFNKKKIEFVNFFSSILQVIQQITYDIQIQIDKQYHQAVSQFKDLKPLQIKNACIKMQQNRVQVYQQMIDRLCFTLKNFATKISNKQQIKQQTFQVLDRQLQMKKQNSNTIQTFQIEPVQSQFHQKSKQLKINSKQDISEKQQKASKQQQVKTPYNILKNNSQQVLIQTPSPFAYKLRIKKFEQKQQNESPKQKSRQKIQVLKRTDVCQSLDNFLNKQAKQMLNKSQRHGYGSNSYNSLRKSTPKRYDTPDRPIIKQFESNNIDRRIQQKLLSLGGHNNKGIHKKLSQNIISPIQRFKIQKQ